MSEENRLLLGLGDFERGVSTFLDRRAGRGDDGPGWDVWREAGFRGIYSGAIDIVGGDNPLLREELLLDAGLVSGEPCRWRMRKTHRCD